LKIIKLYILPFFLILAAMLIAFAAGFWLRPWIDETVDPNYPILNRVVALLRDRGLKDMPPNVKLERGMIKGLLQAYDDPYTVFIEPAEAKLQNDELRGHFGGIGVRMERDQVNHLVLFPYPDSPARQAGLQDGDRLARVDDLEVQADTPLDTIEAALRGPVGQVVRLIIQRAPVYAAQEVIVKRADVALPSTTWNLSPQDPRIGIIRVSVISATSANEISNAAADLKRRGASCFILDLRNNGGGLLDGGVDVARLFLKSGTVIRQQYRGEAVRDYGVAKPGPLAEIPLVVWVNQNTASAAEIIAGALQAQRRAQLVGTPTYGKDSIQLVFNLQDGSSLHVTAAYWWIPGFENSLEGRGLQPDRVVKDDPANNSDLVQAAAEIFGLK